MNTSETKTAVNYGVTVDGQGGSYGGWVDASGDVWSENWFVSQDPGGAVTITDLVTDETTGVSNETRYDTSDSSWTSTTMVGGKVYTSTSYNSLTGDFTITQPNADGGQTVFTIGSDGTYLGSKTYDSAGNLIGSTEGGGGIGVDSAGNYTGSGWVKSYDAAGNQTSEWTLSTDSQTGVKTTTYWDTSGNMDFTQTAPDGTILFSSSTRTDDNGVITTTTTFGDGTTRTSVTDPNTGTTTTTTTTPDGQTTTTTEPPDDGGDDGEDDEDEYIPADFDIGGGGDRGGVLNLGAIGIVRGDPLDMPTSGGDGGGLNWQLVDRGGDPVGDDFAPGSGGSVLDVNRLVDPSSDPDPTGSGGGTESGPMKPPTGGWAAFPLGMSAAQAGSAAVTSSGAGFAVNSSVLGFG
jgi:hypothetical protein